MIQLVWKRLVEVVVFLLVISFISFLFMRLAPGDPVLSMLRADDVAVTKQQVEALRHELGFDKPLLIQYGMWLGDFIRLDFGSSYVTGQPVTGMIMTALPATVELAAGSMFVMIAIAFPLGALAALYEETWLDKAIRTLAALGAAVPGFWLGLMLIDWLAVDLRLLPTMGRRGIESAVLPSLTLGLAMAGVYTRMLRASLIDSLKHPSILAGRARGLSEWRLFLHYALRFSLVPVVTLFGVSLGSLIGGVVVIEVLFSYPGIGQMAIDAIRQRDYPVIQGYMLVTALAVFIINSLVDVSYYWIQPDRRRKEPS